VIVLKDNKDCERTYTKPNMIWIFLSDAIRVANGYLQEACFSHMPKHMIQYKKIIQKTCIGTYLQVVADILEKCSASIFTEKQSKEPF
jgi:hypothetical protein